MAHEPESQTPPESAVNPETEAKVEEIVLNPLEAAIAERDELRDLLLRTRAEMDNMRKRMNRERDEERKYAALPIARDLLPALDNLHRAVDAGQKDQNVAALLQGVQMVAKQIEEILARQGILSIPSVGQPFDPNRHEALQQVPTAEYPPMTVIQEYEKGYQLHDRVVRPSKVIVSSAPPSAS